jgi:hypothetical protein
MQEERKENENRTKIQEEKGKKSSRIQKNAREMLISLTRNREFANLIFGLIFKFVPF